jgi:hypothetical protein
LRFKRLAKNLCPLLSLGFLGGATEMSSGNEKTLSKTAMYFQ